MQMMHNYIYCAHQIDKNIQEICFGCINSVEKEK